MTPETAALLAATMADRLRGLGCVAVGATSPLPAAAALLARARAEAAGGRLQTIILGSRRHNPFTDGGRELFDCAAPFTVRTDAFPSWLLPVSTRTPPFTVTSPENAFPPAPAKRQTPSPNLRRLPFPASAPARLNVVPKAVNTGVSPLIPKVPVASKFNVPAPRARLKPLPPKSRLPPPSVVTEPVPATRPNPRTDVPPARIAESVPELSVHTSAASTGSGNPVKARESRDQNAIQRVSTGNNRKTS
jgi:hypothetical protein